MSAEPAATAAVSRPRAWLARCIDPAIAFGLFAGYLAALLSSVRDLGYARDEGFYFHAARGYGKWFQLLGTDAHEALRRSVIDNYWQENREHPALLKSLFWASQRLFEGVLFEERGTAYRFPGMLLAALTVAVLFLWGRRSYGRAGGVVAALGFACIPSVFYHSHLACFDLPITALLLFVAFAYQRSFETRSWLWGIACGVLYGLALETKHNAWFLPLALLAHVFLQHLLGLRRPWRRSWYRLRIPSALPFMLLLGPPIFYALWPWIWHDTLGRVREYVQFHLQHVYYNMEFLGRTYFQPPFPRSYAWLMTLATVPGVTLWVAGIGACAAAARCLREHPIWARLRTTPEPHQEGPLAPAAGSASLWLLALLVAYGPWVFDTTPIFGGTKHWMPAYPFLALFAGRGFAWLADVLRRLLAERPAAQRLRWLPSVALAACTLLAPALMTWHSHPWGLSAYTPLVGGAPGAATLGLNRSFWGYTTGAVVADINELSPPSGEVFIHDTAMDSFKMLQRDGRLRADLRAWTSVASSSLALYHHEQHMSRVEFMIWVDYGTVSPARVAGLDGVPVVWLYVRPPKAPLAP
jgi:4-amino-4-deoxy-L-arabinose transferase-like glycosyltransferase